MDSSNFIAKITRTKSYLLHPAKGLNNDPAMLVAEFDSVLKHFQLKSKKTTSSLPTAPPSKLSTYEQTYQSPMMTTSPSPAKKSLPCY
jgi:hypothetical protein